MVLNYAELRENVIAKYGNYSNFADEIGYTEAAVSAKIEGKAPITIAEIVEWGKYLLFSRVSFTDEEYIEWRKAIEAKKAEMLLTG